MYVGGNGVQGVSGGGFNGGGNGGYANAYGGGGASDIRIGGNALANRYIVGGGGGGGSNEGTNVNTNGTGPSTGSGGGSGAAGGGNGSCGTSGGASYCGGGGGTGYNYAGYNGGLSGGGGHTAITHGGGGSGGGFNSGGAGATATEGTATAGSFGLGGSPLLATCSAQYGGAGGGGYYGGGGSAGDNCGAGQGGGGSSYVAAGIANPTFVAAAQTGNGIVTISYINTNSTNSAGTILGSTVDYINAQSVAGSYSQGQAINFSTLAGNIPNSAGSFTLNAGETYYLQASVEGTNGQFTTQWKDTTNGILLGTPSLVQGLSAATTSTNNSVASAVITASTTLTVSLIQTQSGTEGVDANGYAQITQLGSSNALAGAASVSFDKILAAIASSTIDNTNFAQTWNWSTATSSNALVIGANSLTTGSALTVNSASAGFAGALANLALSGNATTTTGSVLNLAVTGSSSAATALNIQNAGTGLSMNIQGAIALQAGSDFATSTAYANNANLGNSSFVRVNATSSAFLGITGIAGGVNGRILTLVNASSTASFTLYNQNASSTAANRIITGIGTDLTVAGDSSVLLAYDAGSSRWRVFSGSAAIPTASAATSSYVSNIFSLANGANGQWASSGTYPATGTIAATIGTGFGSQPSAFAFDANGNVYTANGASNSVTKITPSGATSTYATVGATPDALAMDSSGNLYVANSGSASVTKIAPSGATTTYTIVGGGTPENMAMDNVGNVYVVNYQGVASSTVTKITPSGVVTSVWATVGMSALDMVIDTSNNIYTLNAGNNSISKITPSGVVTTTWATFPVAGVSRMLMDSTGNIIVTSLYGTSNYIYKVSPNGVVTSIVNFGTTQLYGMALDPANNLYTSDGTGVIYKVTPTGATSTYVTMPGYVVKLAFDANGTLWAAAPGINNVYKITGIINPSANTTLNGITSLVGQTILIGTTTAQGAFNLNAGLFISSSTPATTTNALYNNGGLLYWNGVSLSQATSTALSQLTGAATSSSLDNTNYAQIWNWSTATSSNALTLTANALSTGSVLSLTSSSSVLASAKGLLYVANTGTSTTGKLAYFSASSTNPGLGLVVGNNGNVSIGSTTLSSNVLNISGGITIASTTPSATSSALYNNGGALYWNGLLINNGASTTDSLSSLTAPTANSSIDLNSYNETWNWSNPGGTFALVNNNVTQSANVFSVTSSGVNVTNGLVRFAFTSSSHTGTGLEIDDSSTVGTAERINSSALTTGVALQVISPTLTTGSLIVATTSSNSLNSTNGLLYVANNGTSTNGTLASFVASTTASQGLYVLNNGNVGIGTSSPMSLLTASGTISSMALNILGSTANNALTFNNNANIGAHTDGTNLYIGANAGSIWFRPLGQNSGTLQSSLNNQGQLTMVASSSSGNPFSYSNTNNGTTNALSWNSSGVFTLSASTSNFSISPFTDGANRIALNYNNGSRGLVIDSATQNDIQIWTGSNTGSATQIGQFNGNGLIELGSNQTSDAVLSVASSTLSGASKLFDLGTSTVGNILTVLANGNVGIGTTTPTGNLVVYGTTGQNLLQIATSTNQNVFVVNQSGLVGIGNGTPGNRLNVTDNAQTTGSVFTVNANGITTGDALAVSTANTALNSTNGFFLVQNTLAPVNGNGTFARFAPNTGVTTPIGLTILNNGNVGIGTTTPQYQLAVNGNPNNQNAQIIMYETGNNNSGWISRFNNRFQINASDSMDFGIGNSTNSGINFTTSWFRPDTDNALSLGGSSNRWTAVYAINGAIQTSDARLKTNVQTISASGLTDVLGMRPVTYQWIASTTDAGLGGTGTHYGFIAQELQAVAPNAVYGSASTTYGVNYAELIPLTVKAIQGQQALLGNFASSTALTPLIATIKSEANRDVLSFMAAEIAGNNSVLTDFVAARVTAIRGYFDEIFANQVHTKSLCVAKADGTEYCVTGDQLQNITSTMSQATTTAPSAPVIATTTPVVATTTPTTPAPVQTATSTPPQDLSATTTPTIVSTSTSSSAAAPSSSQILPAPTAQLAAPVGQTVQQTVQPAVQPNTQTTQDVTPSASSASAPAASGQPAVSDGGSTSSSAGN